MPGLIDDNTGLMEGLGLSFEQGLGGAGLIPGPPGSTIILDRFHDEILDRAGNLIQTRVAS
jgi:hypothetical protein